MNIGFGITPANIQKVFHPAFENWLQNALEGLDEARERPYPSLARYAQLDRLVTVNIADALTPFITKAREALLHDTFTFVSSRPRVTENQRPAFNALYKLLRSDQEVPVPIYIAHILDLFQAETRAPFIPRTFLSELPALYSFMKAHPSIIDRYLELKNLGGIAALELSIDGPARGKPYGQFSWGYPLIVRKK